jgi:hypothetical protein
MALIIADVMHWVAHANGNTLNAYDQAQGCSYC